MANHRDIDDDEEFTTLLGANPTKLIVVDFNATWCGPCHKMAPIFIQLAKKFPAALFYGVDVDKCQSTAMAQGVSAMPTFILYKNRAKVDSVKGAHAEELEEKIRKHYGKQDEIEGSISPGGGIDIFPYIQQSGCECLNESDATPFRSFLEGKSKMISDCDEQLILVYDFNQNIKIQAFKIKAPVESGPKTIRLFINQPKTLDFDSASSMQPVQEIELTEEDLDGQKFVELRFVKFQSVNNLQVFVKDNQTGSDVTCMDSLNFYGITNVTTNMQDFKRIAGNKGESH